MALAELESSGAQPEGEKDFTPEEALTEAIKRWPEYGYAVAMPMTYVDKINNFIDYRVGQGTDFDSPEGHGNSFRAAFAAADQASSEDAKGEKR